MMTKEDLALEQQQMRERWTNRTVKEKPPKLSSPKPGRVALPPVKPAPAKPISRLAPVPAASRSQHQEALALGFSLGVPPVRAGYSTAEIEYACVCGIFSNNPNKCPRCGRKR